MKKQLFKERRIAANLTQKQAAEKIGVSTRTLSRWENGATAPTLRQFCIVASVYKCTFEDFYL